MLNYNLKGDDLSQSHRALVAGVQPNRHGIDHTARQEIDGRLAAELALGVSPSSDIAPFALDREVVVAS